MCVCRWDDSQSPSISNLILLTFDEVRRVGDVVCGKLRGMGARGWAIFRYRFKFLHRILIGCFAFWYGQADAHEASSLAEIQEREPEYHRMVTAVLTQTHYDFYGN